ncbi:CIC_collapsed_G0024430.mRNA.1.CDS.1 [Saccharomyces cerevisiae]|nr:CIC_collapsed_G0024430.mRNA.1.CDS.1 [Saccharomyces cerevisiae]
MLRFSKKNKILRETLITIMLPIIVSRRRTKCSLEIPPFLMEREVFQRSIIIDKDLESDNLGISYGKLQRFL